MCKKITSPRDCSDYKKVESYATAHGATIRQGKGDHAILTYNNSSMTYCRREMGTGIACKIFKWMKMMGMLCLAIIIYINFF